MKILPNREYFELFASYHLLTELLCNVVPLNPLCLQYITKDKILFENQLRVINFKLFLFILSHNIYEVVGHLAKVLYHFQM